MEAAVAGRNQHHIPQFFQRGFGIRIRGKSKEIWLFERDVSPRVSPIKDTAAGFDFYSDPASGSSKSLDDQITDHETQLSRKVAALRSMPIGAIVEPSVAADVVSHLAPRSSHVRRFFQHGMTRLLDGALKVFSDWDNIERLLGLDQSVPSERFRSLTASIRQNPLIQQASLPEPVLDMVVFALAKENLRPGFDEYRPSIDTALAGLSHMAAGAAREGHNKAVAALLGPNTRFQDLTFLSWTIESGPIEGAVLPDCVALGLEESGPPQPYMHVAHDDLSAVIMPLSTDRVLVGRRESATKLNLSELNQESAACSHEFFLAASNEATFRGIQGLIATRSIAAVDVAINDVLNEYISEHLPQGDVSSAVEPRAVVSHDARVGVDELKSTRGVGYEVSFRDCADQESAEQIAAVLNEIVGALSVQMPLGRLDGITFANDYPSALGELDRGIPGVGPPETAPADVGQGIAMSPLILRDGVVKARIIMVGGLGYSLLSVDKEIALWALHTLVHQLALVAFIEMVDTALPGVLLSPIEEVRHMRLFPCVNSALDGYVAACVSAEFGDYDAILAVDRELLISAVEYARRIVPEARLAYRYDGDLDKFLVVSLPAIRFILEMAAKLLGHCAARQVAALDDAEQLSEALSRVGLHNWLAVFGHDLAKFWNRRGEWDSFDDFLRFTQHAERIFWQFGVFPWMKPDGCLRFEIPLTTDMAALAEAAAHGVRSPNIQDEVDPR
jgi:hypothetical protein